MIKSRDYNKRALDLEFSNGTTFFLILENAHLLCA